MSYYGQEGGPSRPALRRPPVIPNNRPTLGANPPVGVARPTPSAPNSQHQSAFMPTPTPVAAPAYSNPTQNYQAQLGALQAAQTGMDPALRVAMGDPHAIMQARANAYANQRLAQLRRIAPQLSPELQGMLGNPSGLDPAAAWRAISGAFTQYANDMGYADPRQLLRLGANRGLVY